MATPPYLVTAVLGSRTFTDYSLLKETLSTHRISKIVSEGTTGVGPLAARYASEQHIPLMVIRPDWYGPQGDPTGAQRNENMVNWSEVVVVFWDGADPLMRDAIHRALAAGRSLHVFRY